MNIYILFVAYLAIVYGQSSCDESLGFQNDPDTNICLFPIDPVSCSPDFYPLNTTEGTVCAPLFTSVECQEGKVWDSKVNKCIPELSIIFCDDDSEYDMVTGLCRSLIQPVRCAPGYVWSSTDNGCAKYVIPSPTPSPTASVTPSITPSSSSTAVGKTNNTDSSPTSSPVSEGKVSTSPSASSKTDSTPTSSPASEGKVSTSPSASSKTDIRNPDLTPSVSTIPSPSGSSSPLPPKPVISTSLLFRPPPNGTLDKSAFSNDVLDSIVSAAATVLGIPSTAVRISGVEPVTAAELAAVSNSTRRRLLGGRFLQSVVGYRVVLAIDAAAAASSPVISNAAGNGTSLSINNLAQVATAVATAVTQTTSNMLNIIATQPSVLSSLGYSSPAQLVSSVSVDPTRPTVAIQSASVVVQASNNSDDGISGGAIAGIVIGVLIAVTVLGGMYIRLQRAPVSKDIMASSVPSPSPPTVSATNPTLNAAEGTKFDFVNPMGGKGGNNPSIGSKV